MIGPASSFEVTGGSLFQSSNLTRERGRMEKRMYLTTIPFILFPMNPAKQHVW
jgi:hypothetical protein